MSEYKSTNTEFPFTPYVDPFTPGDPPPNMPVLTRQVTPDAAYVGWLDQALVKMDAERPALRPSRRVDPEEQALIARQAAERVFDQLDGEAYAPTYAHDPDCNTLHDGPAPCPPPAEPTSNLAAAAASVFGYAPQFDPGTDVQACALNVHGAHDRDGDPCATWEDLATFALEADRRFKRHGVMLDCPHHDPVTGLGEHWFIGGVPGSNDMPVTSLVVWAARHWTCGSGA